MTESEKKLGTRAVKAFPKLFPDAWKHDWKMRKGYCCGIQCSKCDVVASTQNQEYEKGVCTVPTPIEITWDNAHRLVKEVDSQAVADILHALYCSQSPEKSFRAWIVTGATPSDYIKAAIKAKEAE